VLVGSVKFLPFASRSGTNAMMQVSGEIEEAAIIVGVPWIKRMTRILFPIQKSSFISGYLLPFISCMRELTLFVLLTGTGTIMTSLLSYYETKGLDQISNGLNLLIVLTVLLLSLDGYSLETNLTATLACINNIGPGLKEVGPTGNFAGYSLFSQVLLSLNMLLGRLEIMPVLILLSPGSWKKH
jgi:iron(III) transport system permease protein